MKRTLDKTAVRRRAPVPAMPRSHSRHRAWLAGGAIVALALAVRLMCLSQIRGVVFFDHLVVDAREYYAWAGRIVQGDLLGRGVFYQAPLYPYVLAAIRSVVGHDLWRIRVVQAVIGAISCAFLFAAGRRWLSPRAGIIAGLMLALYAPAIFYDSLIQKSVLDLLLLTLLLWLLARLVQCPTRWQALATGVVLGLLALTRENTLLLVPFLIIGLFRFAPAKDRRAAALNAGCVLLGTALILLPVGIRNRVAGGEFALTTSQAGANFYIGNHAGSEGIYTPLRPGRSNTHLEQEDARVLAEHATGRTLTPAEISRYWFGEAWAYIRSAPGSWLRLLLRKLFLLINAYEVPDAEDLYFYERESSLLRTLDVVAPFGIVVPLAAAGLIRGWPRRRELWPLYVILAVLAFSIVLFYVMGRYRLPLVPVLMLFAAAAMDGALRRRAGRHTWAAAVTAAVVAAVASNWPMFQRADQLAMSYVNAGAALSDSGNAAAAVPYFKSALQLRPRMADAHSNLGIALARCGRLVEAIPVLRDACRLTPDDPQVHLRLGTALAEHGELPEAETCLRRAVALFPASREGVTNLAAVLLRLQRWSDAVHVMHAGVEHLPDEPGLTCMLARTLASCPDPAVRHGAEAVRLAEGLLRRDEPPTIDALDALAAAYAETGRYADAVQATNRAIDVARQYNDAEMVQVFTRRRSLYQSGSPYRQMTASAPATAPTP